jgi:hypothetical protein
VPGQHYGRRCWHCSRCCAPHGRPPVLHAPHCSPDGGNGNGTHAWKEQTLGAGDDGGRLKPVQPKMLGGLQWQPRGCSARR